MSAYFSKIKKEYYDSLNEYRKELMETGSSFDGCANLENFDDMEKWHLDCILYESKDTVPPLYSIGYQYLYIEDDEVIGLLNFRPEAMSHPYLKTFGGHIGYNIRPSKRKMGYGVRMLKDFLPIAKTYGLKEVLLTCLEHNEGSKKIIMANGGKYDCSLFYKPENCNVERYIITL
ncbi:MAG: GNAT family N-acetyltransferase [Erysipelotrichaceae bacterium]|nr:GNAT family N-acetyltransferase [Erysipelotrichaceae bacterium]